jgi:soluble lytic murein transglycosylase-like protein
LVIVGRRCRYSPVKKLLAVPLLLAAASAYAGEASFVASDVSGARLRQQGKIVISNRGNTITAFRFFGDIREALFSLRSVPQVARHPYGAVLFDSSAALNSPMPAYLSLVISEAAKAHGVDPRLVAAVVRRESALNPAAVSPVGACGLMQLMPATARFLGVSNVFDVRENVFGGTRYLRTLLDTFDGDLDLTLAAYNAGPGAVQRYNGVPPYAETQAYVRSVRRTYEASLAAR